MMTVKLCRHLTHTHTHTHTQLCPASPAPLPLPQPQLLDFTGWERWQRCLFDEVLSTAVQ